MNTSPTYPAILSLPGNVGSGRHLIVTLAGRRNLMVVVGMLLRVGLGSSDIRERVLSLRVSRRLLTVTKNILKNINHEK